MGACPYTAGIGVLLRDHGRGEVRVGRDGEPVVRYGVLRTYDRHHLRTGIDGAAPIFEAAGAQQIYSARTRNGLRTSRAARRPDDLHRRRGRLRLGRRASPSRFVPHHGQRPHGRLEPTRCATRAARPGASATSTSATASAFPTASGVNPMVTIEAIAHMNARGLAERLA